jgi:hypothetical protein
MLRPDIVNYGPPGKTVTLTDSPVTNRGNHTLLPAQ